MGKQKTQKSISKRFKLTKTGKLKYETPGASHLMVKKSSKVKTRKGMKRILAKASSREVLNALPGRSFKK